MAGRNEILPVELVEIGAVILDSNRAASNSTVKSQTIMGFGVHPRKNPTHDPQEGQTKLLIAAMFVIRKHQEKGKMAINRKWINVAYFYNVISYNP